MDDASKVFRLFLTTAFYFSRACFFNYYIFFLKKIKENCLKEYINFLSFFKLMLN